MLEQNYIESDIYFSFNQDWKVKKYDDHAYFKSVAGFGLKGIDFIGIYKTQELFLIEVKNYRKRIYSPVAPDWSDLEGNKPPLIEAYVNKIYDSLRLIKVVNQSYQRKWWFRILKKWNELTGNQSIEKDWQFWEKVYQLSQSPEYVKPILWLELDPDFLTSLNQTQLQFNNILEDKIKRISKNRVPYSQVLSFDSKPITLKGVSIKE